MTHAPRRHVMKRLSNASGRVGYGVLWLLGIPLPMLILIYLIST